MWWGCTTENILTCNWVKHTRVVFYCRRGNKEGVCVGPSCLNYCPELISVSYNKETRSLFTTPWMGCMSIARLPPPPSMTFVDTHLYSQVQELGRYKSKVKDCPRTQHNGPIKGLNSDRLIWSD